MRGGAGARSVQPYSSIGVATTLSKRLALSAVISLLSVVWLMTSLMLVNSPRTSAASSSIFISAVYYDTNLPNQPEESFRLTNVSAGSILPIGKSLMARA